MKLKSVLCCIALLWLFTGNCFAEIITKTVSYEDDKTALEGFLAYDNSSKIKRPGILMVHEWTGIGDYVKERAKQLARLGYVAFAADIYGKGVRPKTPQEASQESSIYRNDRQLMRKRALAGLAELKKNPLVYSSRIAAIGYCFGGMTVLELARSGADIAGVVSFHGGLSTPYPEDAKNIKAKVLVLHGADDPYESPEEIQKFQEEMRSAKVDWQMIYYGNAVHSFTNKDSGNDPSKGAAYNEKANRRSWEAMKVFFKELFGK